MTAQTLLLTTPAMANPQNWREAILAEEARNLTRFFSNMTPVIEELHANVGQADWSTLFHNILLLAKERMTSLVANSTPCRTQAKEAEQLVSDWVDQQVSPDLFNCIGIALWALGTKPAIEIIRSKLR